MQAICGKLQRVGRQTISYWKNVDLNALRDSATISSRSSSNLSLQSSSGLCFITLLFSGKEFGTKTGFLMPLKNTGIPQVSKPISGPTQCLSQQTSLWSAERCFSTMGNSGESVPQDASVPISDVPERIKFKRLDKTSRHIMQIIDKEAVEEVKSKREIPDIRPGYFVQLRVEVPENKRRVSTVKGVVIARRNAGLNTTFRLRRSEAGVAFESLYPLYSPNIKEIKILDKRKVRRAKLYYLRNKMNAMTALKKR